MNLFRRSGTRANGAVWSYSDLTLVWQKAATVPGLDPNKYRKDVCGALIEFSKHGDRNSQYGWEVDHIVPVSSGGGDSSSNLQPLHWKNNVSKGDSQHLVCSVSS